MSDGLSVTICNVERLSGDELVAMKELTNAAATAFSAEWNYIARIVEQLAADCVRDRKRFPNGDLKSFIDGYWKPAVDRDPATLPSKDGSTAALESSALRVSCTLAVGWSTR